MKKRTAQSHKSSPQPQLVWAQIDKHVGLTSWLSDIRRFFSWSEEWNVEKYNGSEINTAQLIDATRSLNLFSRKKLIVVFDADRFLKKEKSEAKKVLEQLSTSPHPVVMHSEQALPSKWQYGSWKAEYAEEVKVDDKAIFRWIDAIDRQDLRQCLIELDKALLSGQHPLVFVQLLTRHFRIGRLIVHALDKRLPDTEIARSLKIPVFVVQKWKKKKRWSRKRWSNVFDRLFEVDLELKSGQTSPWTLKTLSYELIQLKTLQKPATMQQTTRPASLFERSLLPVVTSFF